MAPWLFAAAPWWLLVLCGLAILAALLPPRRRPERPGRALTAAGLMAQVWKRIVVHPPRRGEWYAGWISRHMPCGIPRGDDE